MSHAEGLDVQSLQTLEVTDLMCEGHFWKTLTLKKKNPMTSCLSLLTWILSPRGAAASRDPLVKGVSDKEKLLDKSFASIRLVAPAPLLSPLPGHCKLCQSTSFS